MTAPCPLRHDHPVQQPLSSDRPKRNATAVAGQFQPHVGPKSTKNDMKSNVTAEAEPSAPNIAPHVVSL